MTPEILAWGTDAIRRHGVTFLKSVLEIGSMNVNGSLRGAFSFGNPYLGIDIERGPGVDEVMRAADIPSEWRFDVVVCTEMIEHDPTFWLTIKKAHDVLVVGGLLILSTCGFGFPLHRYPIDCYRFTLDALDGLLTWAGFEVLELTELPGPSVCAVAKAL